VNTSPIEEYLQRHLEDHGLKGRIVPVERLPVLQREIERDQEDGLLDEELFRRYLSSFSFDPREVMPEAQSIIIVAVPVPRINFAFTWKGRPRTFTVPPTYLFGSKADSQAGNLLEGVLAPAGKRAVKTRLPEKLLAVCSGLAAYGRNNISYVPGMGSFHRLVTFFSDLPCREGTWRTPRHLNMCGNCQACLKSCPTGAIAEDRFLLHAERCLTFWNEKPGDIPFPAWIDGSSHHCLVGCLRCQRVCPENRRLHVWCREGGTFTEAETMLLCEGVPLEQLPEGTARKIERFDLIELLDIIPRNLRMLLKH
jgi:epoxyqueuosine reductase